MEGEFTGYCSYYYKLTTRLAERSHQLDMLVDNAPHYSGETNLSEIDAIITYYREAQAVNAEVLQIISEMKAAETAILGLMDHFQIPRNKVLAGEIPEEVEYQLWADETNEINIRKTKNLEPDDNANIITIKLSPFTLPATSAGKKGR